MQPNTGVAGKFSMYLLFVFACHSHFTGPPQTDDMCMQPNPSLDTSGPLWPSCIFFDIFHNTNIGLNGAWVVSCTALFTYLYGSWFFISDAFPDPAERRVGNA